MNPQSKTHHQNSDHIGVALNASKQIDNLTVRKADHFVPGQYRASASLCSCSRVCVAMIDDD